MRGGSHHMPSISEGESVWRKNCWPLLTLNMCKHWPVASLVLGLSVQNWISSSDVTSATWKLSCFWLEPKVFICVIFLLEAVLVYFDFEAYFHSLNAADGLLMRNHLRGFGNWSGEKVGGSQSNMWPKCKNKGRHSALTLLCLQWAEFPLKSEAQNEPERRNDIYGPVSPNPRLSVWTWWKWKQMLHVLMVQL